MPTVEDKALLEQSKQLSKSRSEARTYYGFGVRAARTVKICTECGAVCGADNVCCTSCGKPLPKKNLYEQSVENVKKCNCCEAILIGEESFCPHCGRDLSGNK